MSNKILVVDDETEIADLIEVYLKNENYTVFKFYTAQEALNCIETTPIDLAILDIMLPDIDGFTLCKKIREYHTYPIIMLTPTEFSILRILLENTGNVVSSEDLFHKIWQDEYYSKSNNTITVHIRHLREKLGDSMDKPRFIKTIWGVGYKIES